MAEPPKADESATGTEPPVAKTYPPRLIPSVDPRPITLADFEDERPALLARFTPKSRRLALGAAAVGLAFALGLVVGRRTAPVPAPVAAIPKVAPAAAEAPKPVAASTAPPSSPEPLAPVASSAPAVPAATAAASEPALAASTEAGKVPAPSKGLAPFNATAAKTNLGNAASRVRGCKDKSVPSGSASTVITFAPSGRVSEVTVTTPTYATGAVGSCIVSKLKTARVPPFSGAPETVKKVVAIR